MFSQPRSKARYEHLCRLERILVKDINEMDLNQDPEELCKRELYMENWRDTHSKKIQMERLSYTWAWEIRIKLDAEEEAEKNLLSVRYDARPFLRELGLDHLILHNNPMKN